MRNRAQAVAYLEPVAGLPGLVDADALAAELGDDPVGLRLARRFLEQQRVGVAAYLREIRRHQVDGVPLAGPVEVARGRLSGAAWRLAQLLACLADEPLRLAWVRADLLARDRLSKSLAWLLDPADDAVAQLSGYGLIAVSADGERIRMTAAVADAVRATGGRRGVDAASLFVLAALGEPDDSASWPVYEHLAEHAYRFTEHAAPIRRMRKITTAVLERLGQYFAACGRDERAALLFAAALEHARDARTRAELTYLLGGTTTGLEAVGHLERAVELAVTAYGTTHPAVARNRHSLASARRRIGDLSGARRELERALAEGAERLGPDHLDLAVGRTSLGILLREEGDLDGSRAMLEDTLAVLVAAAGDDDARVTACRTALADTWLALGDPAAARDQLGLAIAADMRIVGADHPHVRSGREKLAEVMQLLGEAAAEEAADPTTEPVRGHRLVAHGVALDRTSWQWRLTGTDGEVLAEHAVTLDPAGAEYRAFTDLPGWLHWRPAPDRRRSDEARLVHELGEWIGRAVLGPVASALAALSGTVRVLVPLEAPWLLEYPLELAVPAGGAEPLALLPVRLVFEVPEAAGVVKEPVGERLRILAVFSAPSGGTALNLRRERRALERLAAAHPDTVELRVVQYGSSPERLAALLADPQGWDVVHLAGHGGPGELVLETATGSPNPISSGALTVLLRPTRPRLKLLVASWCSSAADTAIELLDLAVAEDPADAAAVGPAPRLAGVLGCTVLAMRHPIGDRFAVNLAETLYTSLRTAGTVGTARWADIAAGAVAEALRGTDPLRPLWLASPVLFAVPEVGGAPAEVSPAAGSPAEPRPAGPAPNEVFVGRVATLVRARVTTDAVLFTGMPGIGKSACAAELAYALGTEYDRVGWHDGDEIERIAVADRELVVVDGLDAPWDQPRCELVAELARRVSERAGRLVLTSREQPSGPVPGLVIETLHPLGTVEAPQLLLADGTAPGPALRRLLAAEGGVPGLLDGATDRAEVVAWATQRILELNQEQQTFVAFLCALDPADRAGSTAIEMVWDPVRRGLTGAEEEAVAAPLIAELAALGLVTSVAAPVGDWPGWGAPMCPAVLEAGQELVDERTDQHVLYWSNEYWTHTLNHFLDHKDGELSRAVVHAARGLLPYRMRIGDWSSVRNVLDVIWQREPAPELVERVGAALRHATPDSEADLAAFADLRAELEARAGQTETEAGLQAVLDEALARGDDAEAVRVGMRLVNLLLLAGRAERALPLADRLPTIARRARVPRAELMSTRVQRPQLLVTAGRYDEGLDGAEQLLREVGTRDYASWHTREVLHNIAFRAAMKLERFDDARRHSDAIIDSVAARNGPDLDLARELLHSALVHREAGNPGLSRELIHRAQVIFDAERDVSGLLSARVALAELESRDGRPAEAVALSRDVLRLEYSRRDAGPGDRRLAHVNLSAHLTRAGGDQSEALAHLIAATLIDGCTGSWRYGETLFQLRLAAANSWDNAPGSLAELDARLAATPNVELRAYLATLPGGEAAAELALAELGPVVRHALNDLTMWLMESAGLSVGRYVFDEAGNIHPEERHDQPEEPDDQPEEEPVRRTGAVRRRFFGRRR